MFDLSGSENDTLWDGGNSFEVQTHYTRVRQITFLIIDETRKSNYRVSKATYQQC